MAIEVREFFFIFFLYFYLFITFYWIQYRKIEKTRLFRAFTLKNGSKMANQGPNYISAWNEPEQMLLVSPEQLKTPKMI